MSILLVSTVKNFIYKGGITVRTLDAIVLTLVIIGAINWGLIGFFNFNLVDTLFGSVVWLTRTIYAIVGIAGVYSIAFSRNFLIDFIYIIVYNFGVIGGLYGFIE